MPMKSRMAGSVVHTFRKAALVNSAGTPDCRNALMSLLAVRESIDGNWETSKAATSSGVLFAVLDLSAAGACPHV